MIETPAARTRGASRRALWLVVVAIAGCAGPRPAPPAAEATTTVIVVRHAEKAAEPKGDPPLTEAGAARAQRLVEALSGMPVSAILSTDYARTRSTAAPLAARLGLTTQLVDARAPDHPKQVAQGVLARHRGQTVVVVGHSNTVPDLVAELGAPKPKEICDQEYDNLFIVQVPARGPATVEARKYGPPSVDDSCRGK
ncbi:MAG: Phosphoglycerate mutase [Myxococcaceae bacterium]|nr:Phosphoglycerate mutase [Myxococcaceae bacterium]